MIDPRIVLLAGGSLVFGTLIVVQLSPGVVDGSAVLPATARRDADQPKLPRVSPPVDSLVATVRERPLFNPDRRPLESPQNSGADLKDKRFAGIVIEPDRRLAIFAVTGAKPLTVTEGDSVDGWRIESITADEIALVSAQGSRTLRPTPDPAGGEGRTQRRNIDARRSAASKQSVTPEAPQSGPKPSATAAAKPPVRTGAQHPTNTQDTRTAQSPGAAQLPRASQTGVAQRGPRSVPPPTESERNAQSSPAAAGTVVRRP